MIRFRNRAPASCGSPPEWVTGPRPDGAYRGYFENEHSEQFVLQATAGLVQLATGDFDWKSLEFSQPDWAALASGKGPLPFRVRLSLSEEAWVRSCLLAASFCFKQRELS